MPKVQCECGYIFYLSRTTANEYLCVPEPDIEQLIDECARGITVDRLIEILDKRAINALLCPDCGRVLVEHGTSGRYVSYVREQPRSHPPPEF
jgi:hypothetical protein